MAAAIAGMIIRFQKRIIEKLREAGATAQSPKTAEEAGIDQYEIKWIGGLIFRNKVKEIKNGDERRYYLPSEGED